MNVPLAKPETQIIFCYPECNLRRHVGFHADPL